MNPIIAETVSSAITAIFDVIKSGQIEKTKRTQIMADRDVAVKRIDAQAKLLYELIKKGEIERRFVYDEIFKRMDIILVKEDCSENDVRLFQMIIEVIIRQIDKPLLSLSEFQGKFIQAAQGQEFGD